MIGQLARARAERDAVRLSAKLQHHLESKVQARATSFVRNVALSCIAHGLQFGYHVNYTDATKRLRNEDICVNL